MIKKKERIIYSTSYRVSKNVQVNVRSTFKKVTDVLTTYLHRILWSVYKNVIIMISKSILTSEKVLIDNSTMFPAVNFLDESDIAIIKTQHSFFFPYNRYHSIMYVISPTFLDCYKIYQNYVQNDDVDSEKASTLSATSSPM